jgi:hypothetical protein
MERERTIIVSNGFGNTISMVVNNSDYVLSLVTNQKYRRILEDASILYSESKLENIVFCVFEKDDDITKRNNAIWNAPFSKLYDDIARNGFVNPCIGIVHRAG